MHAFYSIRIITFINGLVIISPIFYVIIAYSVVPIIFVSKRDWFFIIIGNFSSPNSQQFKFTRTSAKKADRFLCVIKRLFKALFGRQFPFISFLICVPPQEKIIFSLDKVKVVIIWIRMNAFILNYAHQRFITVFQRFIQIWQKENFQRAKIRY